ncbi:MAG: phasin family protein [Gemmatimonadales bacterium]
MAKKIKKMVALPMVKESAHEIWLAGLGAFALAGEEGGRLFKSLVKKGEGLEKMNKARIGKIADKVDGLRGEAKHAVAKVTTPIEAGMTSAMHRLGVPTRKEIANLTKRVEELTRVVAKSKARGPRRSRKATPAPAA